MRLRRKLPWRVTAQHVPALVGAVVALPKPYIFLGVLLARLDVMVQMETKATLEYVVCLGQREIVAHQVYQVMMELQGLVGQKVILDQQVPMVFLGRRATMAYQEDQATMQSMVTMVEMDFLAHEATRDLQEK